MGNRDSSKGRPRQFAEQWRLVRMYDFSLGFPTLLDARDWYPILRRCEHIKRA